MSDPLKFVHTRRGLTLSTACLVSYSTSPIMQGSSEACSPAQSVGWRVNPLVDPDLREVGIGDVGDHVDTVVVVVSGPVDCPHL